MEAQISLAVAFGAGMLSFLSPCVLPLVPAYIGHLSGVSLREESYNRLATFIHALAFVAGFSVIFVAIWVAIGLAGYVVAGYKDILRLVGGAVLILMGLHIAGVLRFSFLDREARMQVNPARGSSLPMSFLVGVVFAAGWTPCIGPVLAGIIGLATFSDTVGQGALLLIVYSLGLGVPFLVTALALSRTVGLLRVLRRYSRAVSLVTGAILIGIGILMLTNMFLIIPRYFYWAAL